MDRLAADAIVAELADGLGLPELRLDASGTAVLVLDAGETIVDLGYAQASGTIEMMIALDGVEPGPAILRQAFAANFSWLDASETCFAIEPSAMTLVLQRRYRAGAADSLLGAVETFVAAAETWSRRLRQAAAEPAEGQNGAHDQQAIAYLTEGAMRV